MLFERAAHVNDTIFKYQKRKHVMATPEVLPLRSDLDFEEESREELIESWTGAVEEAEDQHPHRRRGDRDHRRSSGEFTLTLRHRRNHHARSTSCWRSACRAI